MFDNTCTFYSKENKWKRTVCNGVHWEETAGVFVFKDGKSKKDVVTLFLPVLAGYEPKPGDMVLKGSVFQDVKERAAELFSIGGAKTVTAVHINCFGNEMAHYEVEAV